MWNSAIEFVEDDAACAGGIKARGIPLVASSQTYRARRRTKKGRQIGAPIKTFTFSQIKTQLKKLLKDKRNQIREQRWIPQVKRTRIEGRTSEKIPAGTEYLLHFREDINTFMDSRSSVVPKDINVLIPPLKGLVLWPSRPWCYNTWFTPAVTRCQTKRVCVPESTLAVLIIMQIKSKLWPRWVHFFPLLNRGFFS